MTSHNEDNKKDENEQPDEFIIESSDLDDSVVAEESAQETIKKLREKLKLCTKEKQEYLDGWQRAKAEFANARKRDAEAQAEYRKFANMGLVEELLPVLSSFDMAFGNKEAWEKVDKNWRMGVEYIANQLKGVLENNGIKEIDPLGQPFDPNRDEAIEYIPTDKEGEDNLILKVVQKGYTLNGKTIRAPKVHVGEHKKTNH